METGKMTVLTKIGFKNSTIFGIKYRLLFLTLICSTFLLARMGIVKYLAVITSQNALMIPIVLITLVGIGASITTHMKTLGEAKLVEKMVANQNEIDFSKSELPAHDNYGKSLFVSHFRKFATSQRSCWSEEAKSSLEGYLEEMIFRGPKLIEFFENILPILGLLGTALGIAEATLSKASGASMFVGVGNAIGTTVFALYGKMFISTLNQVVISERNALLKTALVIFRIAEKRRPS